MNRQLTPIAAMAATVTPILPPIAIGIGLAALLAWALQEDESPKPSQASPSTLPPPDAANPPQDRHSTGKFAPQISLNDLRAVFAAGPLAKSAAVESLRRRTRCSRSAAYYVLTKRFAHFVPVLDDGRLTFLA